MALSLDSLLRHEDDDHDHDHDHENEGMSDVILAKVVAMVVLFAASLLCGLLPMLLAKKFKWINDEQTAKDIKSSNKIILVLLSFGGGVLLSTTFLHLMPELGENVKRLEDKGIIGHLPFHLDSFLTCAGFFLMYFVEELVHLYLHRRTHRHPKPPADSALVRSFSIRRSTHNNNCHKDFKPEDSEKPQVATIEDKYEANHNHHHHHSHSHMPVSNFEDDVIVSSLRGLLIVLALSIHELFEGLAVGLDSSADKVWYLFGAISAHKLVIAFCVGVELVSAKIRLIIAIIYIFTFAIVSPIGIGIGIALTGQSGAENLASVILQGLACGTLLYVVFFEILQRDRSGLIQFTSSLVGFLVMFGLQFVSGHSHSHSDEDEDGEHNHNH